MQTINFALRAGTTWSFQLSERQADGTLIYFGPGGSLLSRAKLSLRIAQPDEKKAGVVQANFYLPKTAVVDGVERIVSSNSCFIKFTLAGSSTGAERTDLSDLVKAFAASAAISKPVIDFQHAPD